MEKQKEVFTGEQFSSSSAVSQEAKKMLTEKISEIISRGNFKYLHYGDVEVSNNLVEIPKARYDRGHLKKHKGRSYIRYKGKNFSADIGSMYGALTGWDEILLMDILPQYVEEQNGFSYVTVTENQLLELLNLKETKDNFTRLKEGLRKCFTLTLSHSSFKVFSSDRERKKTVVTEGIPIFIYWKHIEHTRFWGAVLNPLFHRNFYTEWLSTLILEKLSHPRSKRAYRYLEKAMGRESHHYEKVDNLMEKLSIEIKNPTKRMNQLKRCLEDLKQAYAGDCIIFKYSIKDGNFSCSKR